MVITDEGLAALRPLRDLRTIGLAWNKRITDDGVAMLSGSVRAISTINLQCCTMLSDETCKVRFPAWRPLMPWPKSVSSLRPLLHI